MKKKGDLMTLLVEPLPVVFLVQQAVSRTSHRALIPKNYSVGFLETAILLTRNGVPGTAILLSPFSASILQGRL